MRCELSRGSVVLLSLFAHERVELGSRGGEDGGAAVDVRALGRTLAGLSEVKVRLHGDTHTRLDAAAACASCRSRSAARPEGGAVKRKRRPRCSPRTAPCLLAARSFVFTPPPVYTPNAQLAEAHEDANELQKREVYS